MDVRVGKVAMADNYRLGVLAGDGIGPEIVPAAVQVLDAAVAAADGAPIEWVPLPVGAEAIETHGSALPPITLETLEQLDGWLLGPHDSASYPDEHRVQLNPSGFLRKHFDLFANIRPHEGLRADARAGARPRPGRRPGEHRGLLRRPQYVSRHRRVHADRRRGDRDGHLHPPAIERIARQAFELRRGAAST